MKQSTRNKLIIFLILGFIFTTLFAFLGINNFKNFFAHAVTTEAQTVEENNLKEIKNLVSDGGRKFTRVYNEFGDVETFESSLESEYVDYLSSEICSINTNQKQSASRAVTNPFEVTTIHDSGLPDENSIVVVFMGDGYTAGTGANQQGSWPNPVAGSFLSQANNAAQTLINTHPFNLFSHLFKIYAIQAISSNQEISGYPIGTDNTKDTYFGSYFYKNDEDNQYYISMPDNKQTQALNLANTVSNNVAMIQVLANANAHGGVAFWGNYSEATTVRLSLVATQSSSNSYWKPAWHGTVIHEFGHSFGQLMDEHDRSVGRNESRANATQISDPTTVKWSHWIGYEDITVRSVDNGWYVPAEDRGGCIMRASWANSEFCAVCASELTRRMAAFSGETFYGKRSNPGPNTPKVTISSTETRILNYAFNGNTSLQSITISASVNVIGDYSFLGATGLTVIDNQNRNPQTINETTFAGVRRSNILVKVPVGTKQDYVNAGWTEFNIMEVGWLTESSGNKVSIKGYVGELSGSVTIPTTIEGQEVVSIESYALANQHLITEFTMPNTLEIIGNNAFENCTNLTNINNINSVKSVGAEAFKNCYSLHSLYISNVLTDIGQAAFLGCNNLNITVSAYNPNYSAEGNILYNKSKTKIVASGKTDQEIVIPVDVTEILPYAFAENGNLVSVRFASTPKIGEYAFYHCPNLNSVYFDSYDVPVAGENSFSDNDFVLYTRYNAQDAYKNIFSVYTSRIESLPLTITFMSNGQVYVIKTAYNGSTISDLPDPARTGYEFNGWYDNKSCTGNPYQNGQRWESETDIYVYAEWTPKQTTVTLDADGGTLTGANTFSVTYGKPYSTPVTVSRTGYTFEGWYDDNGDLYMTASGQGVHVWDKEDSAVTLKAHWAVESYEIQINDDGSIVWVKASGISDTSCSIEYGTPLNAINLVPIYKASNHGFKEGKIFDHFEYKDSALDWTSVPDLGDNGAVVTIRPCWVHEVHTIYFNANYESESGIKEIREKFDEAISLPVISRVGYTFNGWFESVFGNTEITWLRMPDLTPNEQNNGSIMLYAQWTPITYTVSYNQNGGAGVMYSSTHTYGVYKNLNANAFYKTGHDFIGWATSQTGSAEYNDKESVMNLTNIDAGIVTLYAVWKPRTYNIIYKNLMPDMTVYPDAYTYGFGLTTMPTPYRKSGYGFSPMENFYGWYTSSGFTTKIHSISPTNTGDVYLYANYDYWISSTYASYTHTVTDGKIENQPCHDVNIMCPIYYNDVKNTTLKKIKIVFSMDIWEVDDGYQEFYLYHEDKIIWKTEMEHGPKKDTSVRNYTFTIILDIYEYRNVDWLDLKFGAHGYGSDTWQFNNFELSIYFINS